VAGLSRVAIRGAGVAGSYLFQLLRHSGIEAELFDVTEKYFKPCGEVVTNSYAPKYPWKVITEVHDFKLLIDGSEVYSTHYRYAKWVVIDKTGWVNELRGGAVKRWTNGEARAHELVIDATGPYSRDRTTVLTVRAIVQTEDTVDWVSLEFNSDLTGFYWVFPSRPGTANVGAGFLEVRNPARLLLDYVKRKVPGKVTSLSGAPISVGEVRDKRGRIGEARGLVFPIAGEGIRPAAISAEVAAEAIASGDELDERLTDELADLEAEIREQGRLLRLYSAMPRAIRKALMTKLLKKDGFVDAYLSDELNFMEAVKSVIRAENLT